MSKKLISELEGLKSQVASLTALLEEGRATLKDDGL